MNDLTEYGDQELCLVICNDEYLEKQYRKCIRTGSLEYLKMEIDCLKYTSEQWEELVDMFEQDLSENQKALEERNA